MVLRVLSLIPQLIIKWKATLKVRAYLALAKSKDLKIIPVKPVRGGRFHTMDCTKLKPPISCKVQDALWYTLFTFWWVLHRGTVVLSEGYAHSVGCRCRRNRGLRLWGLFFFRHFLSLSSPLQCLPPWTALLGFELHQISP
jgi:hypothetical protein